MTVPPSERDVAQPEREIVHPAKLLFQLTATDVATIASLTDGRLIHDATRAEKVYYFKGSTPAAETPVGIDYGTRGRILFLPDPLETIIGVSGAHLYRKRGKETEDENIAEYAAVFRPEEIVLVGLAHQRAPSEDIYVQVIRIAKKKRIAPKLMNIDSLKLERDLLRAAILGEQFFRKMPLIAPTLGQNE